MSLMQWVWACDPIGCLLLIVAVTLLILALNWAGGAYQWSNPHAYANLVVGIIFLAGFGIYEWKGRSDGIVVHTFFAGGPNFWLSTFAFAVERKVNVTAKCETPAKL